MYHFAYKSLSLLIFTEPMSDGRIYQGLECEEEVRGKLACPPPLSHQLLPNEHCLELASEERGKGEKGSCLCVCVFMGEPARSAL